MGTSMIATSGNSVKLWNSQNYSFCQEFASVHGRINGLTWNQDGQCMAILGNTADEIILSAVNAKSTTNIGVVRAVDKPTCVKFSCRSPHYLGIGNQTGNVVIWNVKAQSQKKHFSVAKSSISQISFSPNDSHIAAANKKGSIYLFSVVNNSTAGPFKLFDDQAVTDMTYSHVKKSVLGCASVGGTVSLFDTHTNKIVHSFEDAHNSPVTGVAFTPVNELLMISVGYDKKFKCYNIQTRQSIMSHVSSAPLTCATFLKGGQHVALGTMTGQVFVHDLRSLRVPLATVAAHSTAVNHVLVQPLSRTASESSLGAAMKSAKQKSNVEVAAPPAHKSASKLGVTSVGVSGLGESQSGKNYSSPHTDIAGFVQDALSPDVFSPIRSTDQPPATANQENAPTILVNTPTKSLGMEEFGLSPIRTVNQEMGLPASPTLQKVKSNIDLVSDEILSPVRYPGQGDTSGKSLIPCGSPKFLFSEKEMKEPDRYYADVDVNKENLEPKGAKDEDTDMTDISKSPACLASPEKHSSEESHAKFLSTQLESLPSICSPRSFAGKSITPDSLSSRPSPRKKPLIKPVTLNDLISDSPEVSVPASAAMQTEGSPASVSSGDSSRATRLQMDLVRSCVAELLEEFEDNVNCRLMHLQYVFTKQNLKQQEVMQQLFQQHSLNEDLLLENERLREEIKRLKANY